jgi:hypothetical protein
MKSSPRNYDAMKSLGKPEVDEAAGIIRHCSY